MNISPSLAKKISAYTTLAAAFLAGRNEADAQIIYTDVNPDTTFTQNNSLYSLDLNNDGQADFRIGMIKYTGFISAVAAAGPVGNSVMGYATTFSSTSLYLAKALANGDTINSNQQWAPCNSANFSATSSTSSSFSASMIMGADVQVYSLVIGNWLGVHDKFLGLKFKIGTSNYYGWARLDVDTANWAFTVKDYAYNAEADSQILAGQIYPTNNAEITEHENDLYKIKTVNNLLFLSLNSNEYIGSVLSIYSISGQEIRREELMDIETPLKLRSLGKGVYLVKVVNGQKQQVKKVVVNY